MSRIGKQPVAVPAGVKVAIEGTKVKIEGAKGKLELVPHPSMKIAFDKILPKWNYRAVPHAT